MARFFKPREREDLPAVMWDAATERALFEFRLGHCETNAPAIIKVLTEMGYTRIPDAESVKLPDIQVNSDPIEEEVGEEAAETGAAPESPLPPEPQPDPQPIRRKPGRKPKGE